MLPKEKGMRNKQRGFTLIELLIVVTIILIIAAMAIPNLVGAKMRANEAAAVGALKAINAACMAYWTTYNGYPPTLASLGPPAGGTQMGPSSADLLDSVLASGNKSGYVFTYAAVDANGDGKMDTYTVVAEPASRGTTGQRSFFTDQSGTIRVSPTGTATSSSTPLG